MILHLPMLNHALSVRGEASLKIIRKIQPESGPVRVQVSLAIGHQAIAFPGIDGIGGLEIRREPTRQQKAQSGSDSEFTSRTIHGCCRMRKCLAVIREEGNLQYIAPVQVIERRFIGETGRVQSPFQGGHEAAVSLRFEIIVRPCIGSAGSKVPQRRKGSALDNRTPKFHRIPVAGGFIGDPESSLKTMTQISGPSAEKCVVEICLRDPGYSRVFLFRAGSERVFGVVRPNG